MKISVLSSLLLIPLIGCIGPGSLPTPPLVTGNPEHFIQTNYSKDVPRTVSTGEAIITYKDFWARRKFPSVLVFNQQMTISTEKKTFIMPHGHVLHFLKEIEINGDKLAIYIDASDDLNRGEMYYLKSDMKFARFMYALDRQGNSGGMKKITAIFPESFKFSGKFELDPSSEKRFKDFDIIFNGKDANGIHATYREHDLMDPAKVVSTRDLTFTAASGRFSYERMEFQVHRCTGQVLEYTVTGD